MKPLIIIGAGGFGREVAWLIERINQCKKQYNILGFIDDNASEASAVGNYKVIGKISDLENFDESLNIVIAIGNSQTRKQVYNKIKSIKNFIFPSLVDPSCIVDLNMIGKGNIICANNVFTVDYKLSDFNIVNLMCTIGHDVVLDSFITVYPGVNVSGNVTCSECVELGTGSKIIQGISIGENTIVGAGTVIIRNIESNATVVGVPGKVIKRGNNNE